MRSPNAAEPRGLGAVALVLIAGGLVASVVQVTRRPDLNLPEHGVSFYALGYQGFVQSLAIIAVGVGSVALAAGLRSSLSGQSGGQGGSVCIALWGAAVIVAGLIPIDLNRPVSFAGMIHDAAGTVANLFLIVGMTLLSPAMTDRSRWGWFGRITRPLAVVALVLVVVANLGRPTIPWGVGQRVYLGLLLSWLIAAALALRRPTTPAVTR